MKTKRFKVEVKNKDGDWKMAGLFHEKYVEQMVNCAINRAARGFRLYHNMRVRTEVPSGKTTVLR